MNSATILAAETTKLRELSHRRRYRKDRRRQYIAIVGVLQAEQGRTLAAAAVSAANEVNQG